MSGLRVAMVTTFYPPHSFGGDGVGVQRLAHALARRGHEVTVIHDVDAYRSLAGGADPEPAPEPEGVRTVRLRSGLGVLSPLLTQQTGRPLVNGRRIRRILDEGAFDATFFHNVSLVGGPGILDAGRGVTIYEAHEHWLVCPSHVLWRHGREACTGRECLRCVLRHRRPPQLWRWTGMLERRLDRVDAFVAKSRFSAGKHREFGFERPMEVIPYFLPDREGAADAADAGPPPHPRPFFLFVGRLERIKGLDDVIPAMRRLPGADLLVAGDGEHGPALRRLAEDVPNVHFLGRLPMERLRALYRHARALVVPSVCFETFGIILIEAFREGTPVVARRWGPFPEIVEACGGGLLFGDEEEMLAGMRSLLASPERRDALGRAARRGWEERWSEDAVVPRYLELIGRLAGRTGRRAAADEVERSNAGAAA